jgi:hypothetical protein
MSNDNEILTIDEAAEYLQLDYKLWQEVADRNIIVTDISTMQIDPIING